MGAVCSCISFRIVLPLQLFCTRHRKERLYATFSRKTGVLVLVLCASIGTVVSSQGQSFTEPRYDLGASIGYWVSGDVYLGLPDDWYSKNGSFLFRTWFDGYLMPKLAAGVYVNLSSVNFDDFDTEATMYEFGVALKPRFLVSPEFAIKPGVNLGYRGASSDTAAAEFDAFGLNLSVELQYQPAPLAEYGMYVFADTGFLSQPAGGNEDQDITFPPIFYISIGAGI